MPSAQDVLRIHHACEHNLQDVNLELPKNALIVFTGVSGSGKSSLAFDTLFAEGQRRYVESLSTYARQFLQQLGRPAVGAIEGLAPAIAIDQGARSHNPRSTVATVTEIYDHLRVLFAAIGHRHCPKCGEEVGSQTRETIIGRIAGLPEGTSVQVLAPLVRGRKGEFRDLMEDMAKRGYVRARIDGQEVRLDDPPRLSRYRRHDVFIIMDRLTVKPGIRGRIAEAVDAALRLAEGTLIVAVPGEPDVLLSSRYACAKCDLSFEEPTHASFSFNSPKGMCPSCHGLGIERRLDPELLVPDPGRSLLEGAIPAMQSLRSAFRRHWFEGVADHYGFTLDTPWRDLTAAQRQVLLYGTGTEKLDFVFRNRNNGWEWRHRHTWGGIIAELQHRYQHLKAPTLLRRIEEAMRVGPCPACDGQRLRPESLAVTVGGRSIAQVVSLDVAEADRFFAELELSAAEATIAEDALKEIRDRLSFLNHVGLHYLTLDRLAPSLSGGEAQRIRLASQVGSGLVDCLYVLDEPSIGLHHQDQGKLLEALAQLRDQGNTVIVVEHDEQTMLAADTVVDFGPRAGEHGGHIVAVGTPWQISRQPESLTGQYLSRKLSIETPTTRRTGNGARLKLSGARHHNLRDLDVELPLGSLICVTGVSGSGKSSLVTDTLYPILARELQGAETTPGAFDTIEGLEYVDKVLLIDQDPIGRTPRSNPATYTGVLTPIRDLYASLPEARVRGYRPGRFSFNVAEGRCSACAGHGAIRLESDFLADIWVECEACEGRRFDRETLEVLYRDRSIADVLALSVTEAREHFANIPRIRRHLQTLVDVGLGYVRLGQPATTLSGGEAQRVKLAKELARPATGRTVYILDEPTTGLHLHDVQQLLDVLQRFVREGNTVIVVEHHPDVIKCADHVLDLGPGGGHEGGLVVAQGSPESLASEGRSGTGLMLREVLGTSRPRLGRRTRPRQRRRQDHILVKGAREHNLADVEARIPLHKLTVVSGVSGSGKTSLALDTLYAEGQRRFVESLSPYARQFVSQMPKPKVDRVTGLPPAIAIDQTGRSYSPRSTVGTSTEIYDYLRLLFARLAKPHCPHCGAAVGAQTLDQVVDAILAASGGETVLVLAPTTPQGNEPYEALLQRAQRDGWQRARIDGEVHRLPYDRPLDRRRRHAIEVVADRLAPGLHNRARLTEAVEAAFRVSGGQVIVAGASELRFSSQHACADCGTAFEPLTPKSFSFNHPDGWCRSCYGLGTRRGVELPDLVADMSRSLRDGALRIWPDLRRAPRLSAMLEEAVRHAEFDLDEPLERLDESQRSYLLHLAAGDLAGVAARDAWVEERLAGAPHQQELAQRFAQGAERYLRDVPCGSCLGARVRPEAAAARLRERTIGDVCGMPLTECREWFEALALDRREQERAQELIPEIRSRLRFLVEVGLGYLTLGRAAPTLSGGEAQRVKLAGQMGSGLTGVLYVLDEPTVGVHPRDNARVLQALRALRDEGNTVVVVEHDPQTLAEADHVIDLGPGAGPEGGRVVASGTRGRVARSMASATGRLLSGKLRVPVPHERRPVAPRESSPKEWLVVEGAREHNLKDITVALPLGRLVVVTGPSGSGKSTLVDDVLARELAFRLNGARSDRAAGRHSAILGVSNLDQLIVIDQTPIGQTPRSNPGTYVGVFDVVRQFYAELPESRVRGFTPRRFSFNVSGGRCETCQGMGSRCVQMHFLPDVWVTCEECNGRRYNPETLRVTYQGRTISDVLAMPIAEARELFAAFPKAARRLQVLWDVGLGYVTLGQSAPTLSGGEAQRVKLARELSSPARARTLYVLDEPTTGLHTADVQQLLAVLNRLVERGHSVLVIEHNLDVVKSADYVIDLGPEGGDGGGYLVAAGTPEQVAASTVSPTAPYLARALRGE